MRIIEISHDLGQTLSQACEESLRANGRLMSCIEEVMRNANGSQMGERGGYMGMREPGMMGDRHMGGMPMNDRGVYGYNDRMPMMSGTYPQGGMYPQQGGYMGERGYRY